MVYERMAERARDLEILHDKNRMNLLAPEDRQRLRDIAMEFAEMSGEVQDMETKLRAKSWRELEGARQERGWLGRILGL